MAPETYINPLLADMRKRWGTVVQGIIDTLLVAAGELAAEAIGVEVGDRRRVLSTTTNLVDRFREQTRAGVSEIRRHARSDARVTPESVLNVRTLLSRGGLEAVLASLDQQMSLVDDLRLTTRQRVERIIEARYGTLGELKAEAEFSFRIAREKAVEAFGAEVSTAANQITAGRITASSFFNKLDAGIARHYRRLYRAGKRASLTDGDRQIIAAQIQSQRSFLLNWETLVSTAEPGSAVYRRIPSRARLYVERGKTLFEGGWLSGQGEDRLIAWRLGVAEHCPVCPQIAAASPFVRRTLPTLPGAGQTPCLSNCRCFLETWTV